MPTSRAGEQHGKFTVPSWVHKDPVSLQVHLQIRLSYYFYPTVTPHGDPPWPLIIHYFTQLPLLTIGTYLLILVWSAFIYFHCLQ